MKVFLVICVLFLSFAFSFSTTQNVGHAEQYQNLPIRNGAAVVRHPTLRRSCFYNGQYTECHVSAPPPTTRPVKGAVIYVGSACPCHKGKPRP
ncbi:hypothetical protein V6N13_112467 [Hibiscus sabdariffa]|uniref:Uncharacterized protein n=1 Tax=Hibiscus sabdariffa TaxID=183260 RepID=A0ABR2TNU4_9ROSI